MTAKARRRLATGVVAALSLQAFPASSANGEPIRILLIVPREPADLSHAVERIEAGIVAMEGNGPLVCVKSLTEADVVVQFVRYRRAVGKNQEPQEWWMGQYKLLVAPRTRAAAVFPQPERFGISLVGKANVASSIGHVLKTLTQVLSKALGAEVPSPKPDET